MHRFKISKGSDFHFEETRTIDTLDGLLGLIKEFGNDIVVGNKFNLPSEDYDYRITIYDDYLE